MSQENIINLDTKNILILRERALDLDLSNHRNKSINRSTVIYSMYNHAQ